MRLSPMIYLYIFLGLAAFLFFLWINGADAADMKVKQYDHVASDIYLDGWIEPGDGEKFRYLLKDLKAPPRTLFLNSRGGMVGDALKIGYMTKAYGVKTVIRRGKWCLSSCAFIFAAGYNAKKNEPNRWIHAKGKLGVHRPLSVNSRGEKRAWKQSDPKLKTVGIYLKFVGAGKNFLRRFVQTPNSKIYVFKNRELNRMAGYKVYNNTARVILLNK